MSPGRNWESRHGITPLVATLCPLLLGVGPRRQTASMRLEGWSHVPLGYGADFDVASAPWWLRLWFRTPFVDRFAYPRLVDRGFGYLTPHPDWTEGPREPVPEGWRMREAGYQPPGSVTYLRSDDSGR
jgi:hypothetical protein